MDSCRRRLDEVADGRRGHPRRRPRRGARRGPAGPAADGDGARKTRADERARKRREADERKRRAAKLGPITSRIEALEERIGELEKAQAERGAELSDPAVYADEKRRNKLLNEYQTSAAKLEELSSRWEASHEELAVLEAELAAVEAETEA